MYEVDDAGNVITMRPRAHAEAGLVIGEECLPDRSKPNETSSVWCYNQDGSRLANTIPFPMVAEVTRTLMDGTEVQTALMHGPIIGAYT